MTINAIKSFFSPSRIEVAKNIRNRGIDFKKSPVLKQLAEQNDVFIKLSDSKLNDPAKINMQVFRRGIDHVCDIPEYALKHDTGDQIYINWEKKISESEVSPVSVEDAFKKLFTNNK